MEQNLIIGRDSAGNRIKTSDMLESLGNLLTSSHISNKNKLRLILLATAVKEGSGLHSALSFVSFAKLFKPEHAAHKQAHLPESLGVAIEGIESMVMHSKGAVAAKENKKAQKRAMAKMAKRKDRQRRERRMMNNDLPFELSRFQPPMEDIIDDFVEMKMSDEDFPYLDPIQKRVDRMTTFDGEPERELLAVFTIGGVCHSEIRTTCDAY